MQHPNWQAETKLHLLQFWSKATHERCWPLVINTNVSPNTEELKERTRPPGSGLMISMCETSRSLSANRVRKAGTKTLVQQYVCTVTQRYQRTQRLEDVKYALACF